MRFFVTGVLKITNQIIFCDSGCHKKYKKQQGGRLVILKHYYWHQSMCRGYRPMMTVADGTAAPKPVDFIINDFVFIIWDSPESNNYKTLYCSCRWRYTVKLYSYRWMYTV